MEALAYKVRLAAFWLLSTVAFFAYRTLALSADATEVSVLGDDFAPYLLVMMGFGFLALTLPTRLNRLVNLIAGAIVGIAQVIMLIDGLLGYPSATFNLMTGATVVSMGAVVWLAYRWHEPVTKKAQAKQDRSAHRGRTPAGI
jgi:amino acid transporter